MKQGKIDFRTLIRTHSFRRFRAELPIFSSILENFPPGQNSYPSGVNINTSISIIRSFLILFTMIQYSMCILDVTLARRENTCSAINQALDFASSIGRVALTRTRTISPPSIPGLLSTGAEEKQSIPASLIAFS